MGRFLHLKLPLFSRKTSLMILALCWFLGLFLGIHSSISAGASIVSMMRMTVCSRVSIFGLLTAMTLPFLLSAMAVFLSEPYLLFFIAFGKAFLFSFLSFGLMAAYGTAGWLIWLLLMFGDCCFLPFLMLYWIRFVSGNQHGAVAATAVIGILSLLIGSFDYSVISPFLAGLIS